MSRALQLRPADRDYALALRQAHFLPGPSASGIGEPLFWTALLLSGRSQWTNQISERLAAQQEMERVDRISSTLYGHPLSSLADSLTDPGERSPSWEEVLARATEMGIQDAQTGWIRASAPEEKGQGIIRACFATCSALTDSASTAFSSSPPSRLGRAYWQGAAPALVKEGLESLLPGQAAVEQEAMNRSLDHLPEAHLRSYLETLANRAREHARAWLTESRRRSGVREVDTLTALHQYLVAQESLRSRPPALALLSSPSRPQEPTSRTETDPRARLESPSTPEAPLLDPRSPRSAPRHGSSRRA